MSINMRKNGLIYLFLNYYKNNYNMPKKQSTFMNVCTKIIYQKNTRKGSYLGQITMNFNTA